MKNFSLSRFFATFFCLGFFPWAAGSLASLAGALFWVQYSSEPVIYSGMLAAALALGFLTSGRAERQLGRKDPPCVVMDEFAGALIAFWGLPPHIAVFWTAFFLFRAFDMFKIYPANRFEERPGSVGIMMDDVVAGLYTNLVMQIAIRLIA